MHDVGIAIMTLTNPIKRTAAVVKMPIDMSQ